MKQNPPMLTRFRRLLAWLFAPVPSRPWKDSDERDWEAHR